MQVKKFFPLMALLFILFIGCNGINAKLSQMYSIPVQMPYGELDKRYCTMCDSLCHDTKNTLVWYWNGADCTDCKLSELSLLETMINDSRNYSSITLKCIVDVKKENVKDLFYRFCRFRIKSAVYFDTLGIFRKMNPQIPDEEMFHTFLLDERDSVVLVGDPTKNQKIEELLI